MLHGISEQDWENYLSGETPGGRIDAHLVICPDCRLVVERMKLAERQFKRAISAAKQRVELRDEQIYQGLRGVFLRLAAEEAEESDAESRQQQVIEPWLRALETALAELCGNHTAVRVLHAAAKNSPARSLEKVGTGNWQPFLENLTSITQVVCGEPGAQLVGEIGRFPLWLSGGEVGGRAAFSLGSFPAR